MSKGLSRDQARAVITRQREFDRLKKEPTPAKKYSTAQPQLQITNQMKIVNRKSKIVNALAALLGTLTARFHASTL